VLPLVSSVCLLYESQARDTKHHNIYDFRGRVFLAGGASGSERSFTTRRCHSLGEVFALYLLICRDVFEYERNVYCVVMIRRFAVRIGEGMV
jgi:hypothetical protein